MTLDEIDRIVQRELRRVRRRRAILCWLDKARHALRRVFSLHSWRRCRDCGKRLGWHGYTDHIPF